LAKKNFNMGKPIKIMDLTQNMIDDYSTNELIDIKIIGLRPGEKLHEEKMDVLNEFVETKHPKIFKSTESKSLQSDLEKRMAELELYIESGNELTIIELIKVLIPDFTHQNPKREIFRQ
jgi:FlaA1/EpsC-like NDP-sugar epimerase